MSLYPWIDPSFLRAIDRIARDAQCVRESLQGPALKASEALAAPAREGLAAQQELSRTALTIARRVESHQRNLDEAAAHVGRLADSSAVLDTYLESFRSMYAQMESIYGANLFRKVGWGIQESLVPMLDAIKAGLVFPGNSLLATSTTAGVLAAPTRDVSDVTALSWFNELAPARLRVDRVEVRVDVECSFCGEPLIQDGQNSFVESTAKLAMVLRVTPLCPTCIRRAEQDPGYWHKRLEQPPENTRPSFTLIRGDGDGARSGDGAHLRLVESEERSDE